MKKNNGKFTLEINMLTGAFCSSSGLRDSDCEAYELANILHRIAYNIEGERGLMEDTIIDSDGNKVGYWERG